MADEPSVPQRRLSALADVLRTETFGGMLLLIAVALALIAANTEFSDEYEALAHHVVGPHLWHLDLELEVWAADGLLAIFFFVAGLELKREFVVGELQDRRKAAVPVVAAVCGVVVPALIYTAIVWNDESLRIGWGIPTATDIAFALAVLAVVGSALPTAVRTFLLTLAVVDDLIAIVIIAIVYSDTLHWDALFGGVVAIAMFGLVIRTRRIPRSLVLGLGLVLALVAWGFVHASGIHATVAGVALALLVPVRVRPGEQQSLEEWLDHRIRPISAVVAVPVFAFFASGVPLSGVDDALHDPTAYGVVFGLVLGKAIGISGGTWSAVRLTGGSLDPSIRWPDVAGISLLAGIGFTVSLLISELAFGPGSPHDDSAKIAILAASVVAAVLGSVVLRRWGSRETVDHN